MKPERPQMNYVKKKIQNKREMKREYEQKDILMLFIANRSSAYHKNWPIVVFALAA